MQPVALTQGDLPMGRLALRCTLIGLPLLVAVIAYVLLHTPGSDAGKTNNGSDKRGEPARQMSKSSANLDDAMPLVGDSDQEPEKLPETPPPGLPILAWGARDSFRVIRKPWYVSARQGDTMLADDEPVLGLVIGSEARAYSTNQLNEHEMVL